MKVTVDLDALVAEGKLTPAEAAKLRGHSRRDTVSGGINLLVTVGMIAIVLALVSLLANWRSTMLVGVTLIAVSIGAEGLERAGWRALRTSLLVMGVLLATSGFLVWGRGSTDSFLITAAALLALALYTSSGFVAVLAAIAIGPCLNSSVDYTHAVYVVVVQRPLWTIGIYGAAALIAFAASERLSLRFRHPLIIFSRASLFLAQFGFWVGSLWGDPAFVDNPESGGRVSPETFAAAWAVTLLAVGVWAARANRRWVVNMCAVFGMIDFYTQWFERLHASAGSVLGAGLVTLAAGIALTRYNRR